MYGNALTLSFLLGLFLRRVGHEVKVFHDAEAAEQDRPEWEYADVREMAALPLVPVKVDVKRFLIGGLCERQFRRQLAEADVVQTFGEGVIWSAGCGAPDTVLSIGDDLDDLPFRRHSLRIRLYAAILRRAQRRCRAVCYTMPPQAESCRKLGLHRSRFLPCAIPIDTDRFRPLSLSERNLVRMRLGLPERDIVVFQPSRQQWTCPINGSGSNHKGNDRFLRAFARFLKGPGRGAWLLAVKKGADLVASQRLVEQLGIGDRVRWVSQQDKAGLRDCFGSSNIVADQFTYGFYGISTLEAMSVGRPVLVYLDGESLKQFRIKPPPVESVYAEQEIYGALCRLAEKRADAETLGERARLWVQQHHSWEPVVDRYVMLYKELGGQN